MKVHHYLACTFCVWINPALAQFYYSIVQPQFPTSHAFLPAFPQFQPIVYNQQSQNPAPNNPSDSQPFRQSSAQQNIPEFHGFGYKTEFQDGATSTVFYVTGNNNQLNFRDFPPNLAKQIESRGRSLNVESNTIDQSFPQINGLLQPAEFDKLFDQTGLFNFYTYPASTAPLNVNITASTTTTEATTTTTSTVENLGAESIVNTNILINEVENRIKTRLGINDTAQSNNTTTDAASFEIRVEDGNETTTLTPNDTTTLETTTEL